MANNKSRNVVRLHRHSRIRRKVHGTPERPRLNIYRSLSQIYAQVIDDEGGQTLVSASTIDNELRAQMKDLNPTEQARIVGKALASRAIGKGIHQVTFDRGGFRYSGRVKALAESAREGGLEF
jgi:large subunit ribosomal protein L18